MKAILAVNNEDYIGLSNEIPWKCSQDLKHFKKLTKGNIVLVGHNTFTTLPTLGGRHVVVDSPQTDANIRFLKSVYKDIDVWCIGGRKTYEKYCHLFTELHVSHITDDTIGDVKRPDLQNISDECKIFNYYFDIDK